MKTLTEFFGPHLLRALQTRAELVAGGKTPEELPAALGESLKMEGEKLQRLGIALDLLENEKKKERVKRVVVLQPAEGQKAPAGAFEREGLVYLLEYFPAPAGSAPQKQPEERDRKGGRGDRKGKGRGDRRGRPGAAAGGAEGSEKKESRPRRRRPEGEKRPRPEGAPVSAEPLKAPQPRPAAPKPAES
jgi:hypothetical protein